MSDSPESDGEMSNAEYQANPVSERAARTEGAEAAIADVPSQGSVGNPTMDQSTSSEFLMPGGIFTEPIIGSHTSNIHHEKRQYRDSTVNETHNYYFGEGGKPDTSTFVSQQLGPSAQETTEIEEEGYFRICPECPDIFMYQKEPLVKGTSVFKGFQKHVGTSERIPVAIKKIVSSTNEHVKEVKHLVTLESHPNVVRIIRSTESKYPDAHVLYIVMELCSLQNLQDYLDENRENCTPFNSEKAMNFTKHLLRGMKHIHDNGIVHRDVKPENILLSVNKTQLKFTDFGLGKELHQGRSSTKASIQGQGTIGYRAPETFSSDKVTKKSDVFSLGITIFGIWSNGNHPFGPNIHLRDHNIINANHDFSGLLISGTQKENFLDLIRSMLRHDPSVRPTVDEVLKHSFFKYPTIRTGQDLPMTSRKLTDVSSNQTLVEETDPKETAPVMIEGDQPPGNMSWRPLRTSLPGHPWLSTLVIEYKFPEGSLNGVRYDSREFEAYLPYNSLLGSGLYAYDRIERAFIAGQVFKLQYKAGESTGEIVWGDIPHKTNKTGGPENNGYPDPDYPGKLYEVLREKGFGDLRLDFLFFGQLPGL